MQQTPGGDPCAAVSRKPDKLAFVAESSSIPNSKNPNSTDGSEPSFLIEGVFHMTSRGAPTCERVPRKAAWALRGKPINPLKHTGYSGRGSSGRRQFCQRTACCCDSGQKRFLREPMGAFCAKNITLMPLQWHHAKLCGYFSGAWPATRRGLSAFS